ncbi:hypothetical protein GF406_14340 [candidate division KSB1 bacterium]|nr:hypothetical protein [candidate division KSB1 bacterium]
MKLKSVVRKSRVWILFVLMGLCTSPGLANDRKDSELDLVFIVDGLRPKYISRALTPNLFRLVENSVWVEKSHAVYPMI